MCAVESCQNPVRTRGYCNAHYTRLRRHGRLHSVRPEGWKVGDTYGQEVCSGTNCNEPHFGNGYCRKHRRIYVAYNLTPEQFDEMLIKQEGVCRICQITPDSWYIDHDHKCCSEPAKSCGKCVRGLLCNKCNSLLGFVNDDAQTLVSAVAYLSETSKEVVG